MIRLLIVVCVSVSALLALSSVWIEAKAAVGQVLLENAWNRSLKDRSEHKAWPWADTWPVAKLSVPKLDKSMIVLEGVSGESMAFGPGRIATSQNEEGRGVVAIGGHRDSHLQFLQYLSHGDELTLQNQAGELKHYRISLTFVADSASDKLLLANDEDAVVLITCYPFNALQTGGPMRYVVVAQREIK